MSRPPLQIPAKFKGRPVGWIDHRLVEMQQMPMTPMAAWPRAVVPLVSWPDAKGVRQSDWCFPWVPVMADDDALADEASAHAQHWEPGDVSDWMTSAMRTLKLLPANHIFPAGYRSCMPAAIRDFMDAYSNDSDAEPAREVASRDAIARMDIALAWLEWLPYRRDVVIVTGFAEGKSSRRIARRLGKHHPWVLARHRRCLHLIAKKLNSAPRRWTGI